jgi:hypothetical protein
MSVTAQAQAVSKAIDAFKDTPTSETFQALREKLTTLIGYQCFAALPNVAVESGGTRTCPPSIGEGIPGVIPEGGAPDFGSSGCLGTSFGDATLRSWS